LTATAYNVTIADMTAIAKIRAFRKRAGLTQKRLGEMLGVEQKTVASWERGRRKPSGPVKKLFERLEADAKNGAKP
jgi:DNA-binding transcriptional regulator YiaG